MPADTPIPAPNSAAAPGWGDVISHGRLPRFALVCAGVWLNAAETLMTATIMPSVAADIRGYAWFGWVVAIYLLGSILAGATSGRLAQIIGLKRALILGGLTYAAGCVAGAVAPTIFWFIAGRLLQGIGGGWGVGLCYVAVTRLFPQSLWARVISALAGVWGVASLISPLVGGLFAEAGFWRGAFWIFAVQGVIYVGAAAVLAPASTEPEDAPQDTPRRGHIPFGSFAVLAAAILAIGAAGLATHLGQSAVLAVAGCGLLGGFLYLNSRALEPLIPHEAANPATGIGAGLAMLFCMTAGTATITAYLPALLQKLYGASPVTAGYLLVSEALAWTAAAFLVGHRTDASRWIRIGAVMIVGGMVLFAALIPHGGLWLVPVCTLIEGAGFGVAWSFTISRMVANAPPGEEAIASSAAPTMQMIGTAVGSAASGVIAAILGFGQGITVERATAGGFWLFAVFAPLTAVGAIAAWRLATPRFDPTLRPADTVG